VTVEREKQLAAHAAAGLVEDGMLVGLGTGSTVAYLLPALSARGLDITCVATSPATATAATTEGLRVVAFSDIARLDMAIDGADQVDAAGWLVKGGGGAHTRERIVAAAADQFIVIASSNKVVERIGAPVPLELVSFGLSATLASLPDVRLRAGWPPTPDGGVLADYRGEIGDPAELATVFEGTPGVIAHGLFAPSMVDRVLIGRGVAVEEGPTASA
jgi:ribose 5-phosphate isomerase A